MVCVTQSRSAHVTSRRAKSLIRNPLPSFRQKVETPSESLRKRTLSLISEPDSSEFALAAKNAEICKLNQELIEMKAETKRLQGVSAGALQRKIAATVEENERLVSENEHLKRSLMETTAKSEELASALEREKENCEEKLVALQQEVSVLKVEKSDLAAREQTSKDDLTKLNNIFKEMQAINATLEKKITAFSLEMETVNKEKYQLSIRLQTMSPFEEPAVCKSDLTPSQLAAVIGVQKDRISFLEKKQEALRKEISDLQVRLTAQSKESESVFAELNKQITDLSLAKSLLETVTQQQTADLEATRTMLAKGKTRIQELKRAGETQRTTIRNLQGDILQIRSEANRQKTKNQLKSRDLAAVQNKLATSIEVLWEKETELLRKEAAYLRLEEDLRNAKAQFLPASKSRP